MIWVDREVKKIISNRTQSEWVDDMKTPSGRVHVGALRGVVIHDMIHKTLLENGVKSRFSYVFNDFDQMDAIPSYLDAKIWNKYSGMPLFRIPSPDPAYKSFAEYFAREFIDVFNSINCKPEIIWSSDLYVSGKMNGVIKTALDNAAKIREIYLRIAKADRGADWHPFQAECEKCKKIGTTYTYKWDGTYVYYRCDPKATKWTEGCGHEGKISPFNGTGKLHWKVDWPAYWKVIGVTIEGSGKDHMSAGGSYDVADAMCKEVFSHKTPYAVPYEWFTIGGKKMSSSKGIGSSALEVSKILPPEVFRFLIVRTPVGTHLDFNPFGDTILNLFDDYDRCLNAYYDKQENKITTDKQGEVKADFARIITLSEVRALPKQRPFLPRFRTIVNALKSGSQPAALFEKQKRALLSQDEHSILAERMIYAQIYLDKYAAIPETDKAAEDNKILTAIQSEFIKKLIDKLEKSNSDREMIQNICFSVLKDNAYKPKDVFPGFYRVLTGKDFGPKAADIILEIGLENVLKKLREAIK